MIDWLGRMFGWRSAVEKHRENPVLVAAVRRSAEIYQNLPLQQFIDNGTADRLARQIYLELNAVCNAVNPLMAGREKLAEAMHRFALYQVLMLVQGPAEDSSELRGLPGISGELKPQLAVLAQKNITLRSELHNSEYFNGGADLWLTVQTEYWINAWKLETHNAARIEMNDLNHNDDWYRAFLHAACAHQEHLYRIDLNWSSAFDEAIARMAPAAYSIFTDIVVSGAGNPLAEWHEYHGDTRIPTPGNRHYPGE